MTKAPLNLGRAFAGFSEHWRPRIAAEVNDCVVKLVKFQGEFVWHSHAETEELFLIHKGSMTIRFRDHEVHLGEGDLFVVPRNAEHITVAEQECEAILVERAGTRNTGETASEKTAHEEPRL